MADTPGRSGPTLLGTTPTTLHTGSSTATDRDIVRTIDIVNSDTTVRRVTFGIHTGGGAVTDSAGKRIMRDVDVWPGVLPLDQYRVLVGNATNAEILYALTDVANLVAVTVHYVRRTV